MKYYKYAELYGNEKNKLFVQKMINNCKEKMQIEIDRRTLESEENDLYNIKIGEYYFFLVLYNILIIAYIG